MPSHRPIRICHLIYRLDVGGLENGLVNLVNHMPAGRFRHDIVCLAGYSEFRQRIARADTTVESIGKREGKDPRAYLRVWHVLRRLRPDIVHTRNIGTVDMQWVAAAAGVRHRVHGEHGWSVGDARGQDPGNVRIRRACRPVINRYVAVSRDIAGWLERDVGVPAGRIRQLYNGVDTMKFQPQGSVPLDLPWGAAAPGMVTFGTVGRLDPIKNQGRLLEALRSIVDRNPAYAGRLRLIIAGDGPLRAGLAERTAQLGLQDHVWLAGAREDVSDLMRAMDVFVLPSLNEGISNTILEAMACGRAVLAGRVGGNPELVEHEATGLLCQDDRDDTLEAAMMRYADDPALRAAHGAAARRRVLERFSLQGMVERYAGFYEEVLAAR